MIKMKFMGVGWVGVWDPRLVSLIFKALFVVFALQSAATACLWFPPGSLMLFPDPAGIVCMLSLVVQIGYWLLLLLVLWDFRSEERFVRGTSIARLNLVAILAGINGLLLTGVALLMDFSKQPVLSKIPAGARDSMRVTFATGSILDGLITFFFWLGVSFLLPRVVQLSKEQELTV